MAERTAGQSDRCPYARPFAADFSECPAYIPRRWAVRGLDEHHLAPIWTCWHLTEGQVPQQANRFYPRCGVGDAADRWRWAEAVGQPQVSAYRAFRQAVGAVDDGLVAAAMATVRSSAAPRERGSGARRQAVERLVDELRRAGAAHEHLLAGSGLTSEDWVAVTDDVFHHALSRSRVPWRPAPELLDRLTPAGRRLVLAMAGPEGAGGGPAHDGRRV
ncbi:MAG: hypothetical protein ABI838_05670 [Chloroflexota bacterium]